MPFRSWPISLRRVTISALVFGLIERVGWALVRQNGSATGEAFNVAVAVAKGRGFADAFAEGQGPTAHLLPIPPTVAGGVYATFGIQSAVSETILLALALGLVFGSYWLLAGFFLRLGAPLLSVVGGFVFLCVAPIYTGMEVFDFRVWEGGMTMTAIAIFLRLLVSRRSSPVRRTMIAALPALIFFLNPICGIAACCVLLFYLWRRQTVDRSRALAVFAVSFLLLFGPWTVRNSAVMGHPIWLRDNLGLELAVANHAGAVAPGDPKATFDARLEQVHPFVSVAAYRALQHAGGEVAYARKIGDETSNWMKAHPGDVGRIWLRHLQEILLPPPWHFQTAHGVLLPIIRSVLIRTVHVLGLLGLILLWRRDRFATSCLLPFVLLPILAYIPFQPITRYTWLFYIPLAYSAGITADALLRRCVTRPNFSPSGISA